MEKSIERKKNKKNSRRIEIIEHAAKIFREKGYKNATLKDVVEELQITAPALYYHVKNKQEILFFIYQKTMNLGLEAMKRIVMESISPDEKLKRAVKEYLYLVSNNMDIFTVFFQEKQQLTDEHFFLITEQEKIFVKHIQDIYKQGVTSGDFIELDPAIVVNGILGACSWIYKWYDPNEKVDIDSIVDIFYQMISNGLKR
ncbi:TetR/AcrR family transcriptional regulator [Fredinandcohnia onubensis]|uniref:TetR/AcrR family transcriptional regulator n=1 Tax=Fredinandcohnia onubensis TaxID=1571209 RepID=UPI000C0BD5EF|nr:TetR/AcrR family transcriptional regulator [Fredinandcohnia onubensis]